MLLHANAIAQNGAAGIGAGGINRDNSDCSAFLAIVTSQLVYKRALTRARRTGQAQDARVSAVGEKLLEQIGPPRRTILDGADGTRESARITAAKLIDHGVDVLVHLLSVKQQRKKQECWTEAL
jgi:hypothetical protein